MSRTQIATRVTDGTLNEIKSYADKHDLTQAEAMRQLLDAGLDVKNNRAEVPADKIRSDLDEIQNYLKEDEVESEDEVVIRNKDTYTNFNRIVLIALTLILAILVINVSMKAL